MKRFFVAADVRRVGSEGKFLPAWEAIDAPDGDAALIAYNKIYEAKGYEVGRLWSVKEFAPAREDAT